MNTAIKLFIYLFFFNFTRLKCEEGGPPQAAGAVEQLNTRDDAISSLHPTHTHSQTSASEVKESGLPLETSAEPVSSSEHKWEESVGHTVLDTHSDNHHHPEALQHHTPAHTDKLQETASSTAQQTISVKDQPPYPDGGHEGKKEAEVTDSTRTGSNEEEAGEGQGSVGGAVNVPDEGVDEAGDMTDEETISDLDPASLSGGGKADIPGKAQSDHFQSYSEWRQKVLEEEQKSKQDNTGVASNQQTVSKPKVRINLASNTCGGKVLASNPEAENVQGVLTSNRDDYMLNPCSAPKKWFVIELCEPVQVKTIEIASLELFSSQPRTFRLLSSDRFPAKEWREQGEFEATEEKTAQVFQVEDQHFLKFLKLELLDHYGHEHFCPVTLFRVFGLPMADDDDDGEDGVALNNIHPENAHSEEETVLLQEGDESDDKENSRNLFMSAKDTVLNLVKKVLYVDETDRDQHLAVVSEKLDVNISTDGFLLPCVPETDEMDRKLEERNLPTTKVPHPQVETTVPNGKDVPIVTKLQDDEQIPSESSDGENLVTLVASEHAGPLDICGDNVQNKTNYTTTSQHRVICSYVQTMLSNKIEQTCSMLPVNTESSTESIATTDFILLDKTVIDESTKLSGQPIVEASTKHSPLDSATKVVSEHTSKVVSLSPPVTEQLKDSEYETLQESRDDQQHSKSHSETSSVHSSQAGSGVLSRPVELASTPSSESQVHSQAVDTSYLEPSISNHAGEGETSLKQTPHLTTSNVLHAATESLDVKESSNILHVSPSPASELVSSEGGLPSKVAATVSVVEEEEGLGDLEGENVEPELPPIDRTPADSATNNTRGKELDLVHVPLAPIAKRETAIMRLTNRIKALELNVSLSSRFLDELSHRFKKQSEDMMKLLNKTISHFNNVTSRAEARDWVQQEQMDKLESRVENLTVLMSELSLNMEQLNSRITDRQLVWTTVEFVLLVLVCVVCLRRGGGIGSGVPPAEMRQLLEMMPRHPQLLHTRRNSLGAVGHVTSATPIKKQASDSALAACSDSRPNFEIVEQKNLLLSQQPAHRDGCKRKKKKKHKNLESKSLTDTVSDDRSSSTKLTKSAGLLFGTDAVSVLTGDPTSSPPPASPTQMKSSTHKSSSKSLPTHSRQSSQTSIEIHRDLPKSNNTGKVTHPNISKSSSQPVLDLNVPPPPAPCVSDLASQGWREEWGRGVKAHHTGPLPGGLTNGSDTHSQGSLPWRPPDNQSALKGSKGAPGKRGWSLRKSFGFE